MAKFKVGDRVRVKDNGYITKKNIIGKIATITDINALPTYVRTDLSPEGIVLECLELIEPEPDNSEFGKGDKVKIIDNGILGTQENYKYLIGQTAVIKDVPRTTIITRGVSGEAVEIDIAKECLTLIESGTTSEFEKRVIYWESLS